MPTDYDAIFDQYQRAKRQPWRNEVEAFTLFGMLGDLTGRSVVDLACGDGHYTRRFSELGATRVVGVDLSEGMIGLARTQEAERPLGIAYFVQDCRSLRLPERFDVATAAYLLNYASSRDDLATMASSVASCLKPGGRFVTLNANPDLPFDRGETYRKYGFEVRARGTRNEGMPYTWVFHLEDGPIEVENYWLPASAYEDALRSAGFAVVRWQRPLLATAAETSQPSEYWYDLLEHPPIIGIECVL